jgi:TolB-like protein
MLTFCSLLLALGIFAAGERAAELPPVIPMAELGPDLAGGPRACRPWGDGYQLEGEILACDNGSQNGRRGATWVVTLDQTTPAPIYCVGWSKADNVGGRPDGHYAFQVNLDYGDGSPLEPHVLYFDVGTHDWQRHAFLLRPQKPVKYVRMHELMRFHTGKAWFRAGEVRLLRTAAERAAMPTVAVLDLADRGPAVEMSVLCTAVAEMLASDLAQYAGLRVVERVRVGQFLREAKLQAGFSDEASRRRAAEALAADYLLAGSVQGNGDQVQLELVLVRVGRAAPLGIWRETTPAAALPQVEARLVGKVLAALNIPATRKAPPRAPAAAGKSPLVAILALRNLSPEGQLDTMESGFADILQANLAAMRNVRMVEREQLYALLREQRITLAGVADPQTALRVGKLLGAERLIYGSFLRLGTTLRIDLRLADAQTASLVCTETATGPVTQFAQLLEDLALRLAGDLALPLPDDAKRLVQAAAPTQQLEAAVHLAHGDQAYRAGRYRVAAQDYERVLLVEPQNLAAALGRARAWNLASEFLKATEAAEQGLTHPAATPGSDARIKLINALIAAKRGLGREAEAAALFHQLDKELAGRAPNPYARTAEAINLSLAGRHREAIAMMQALVERERTQGTRESYILALQSCYGFLVRAGGSLEQAGLAQGKGGDAAWRARLAEESRETAQLSVGVLDTILTECERHPDPLWDRWARGVIYLASADYIDARGFRRSLLSDAERAATFARLARVFAHLPLVAWQATREMAELHYAARRWPDSLAAYDYLLEHPDVLHVPRLPESSDRECAPHNQPSDRLIEARTRKAQVLVALERSAEAAAVYQQLVAEMGLNHGYGSAVAQGLRGLGQEPRFPDRCALVWGGGDRARKAYSQLLAPLGFTTHRHAQSTASAAELAPYRLLILVRSCGLPFTPSDILAVRAFVAGGGSLLVVVSPGWDRAQPGTCNPLLALFGMRAGDDMLITDWGKHITPHPITQAFSPSGAKCGAGLEAPPSAVLLRSDQRPILAALDYRAGRVVAATFGQWFLPEQGLTLSPSILWANDAARYPRAGLLPVDREDRQCRPLLGKVLAWLGERRTATPEITAQRQRMLAAQHVARNVQYQLASRAELQAAIEHWVTTATPGVEREESLWAAGEAALQLAYEAHPYAMDRVRPAGDYPPPLAATAYRRLLAEFPDSPLKPYAQWRAADCARRAAIHAEHAPQQAAAAAAKLAQVDAPEGSYAWAWTRLGLGQCRLLAGDYAAAARQFQQVADRLDQGPEKSLAALDAGLAFRLAGDTATAARYYQSAWGMPDRSWMPASRYEGWAPLGEDGRPHRGTETTRLATANLRRLGVKPSQP